MSASASFGAIRAEILQQPAVSEGQKASRYSILVHADGSQQRHKLRVERRIESGFQLVGFNRTGSSTCHKKLFKASAPNDEA